MNWANAESVLQLTIGLNLAYFTFRELRAPAAARLDAEHSAILQEVDHARTLFDTVPEPAVRKPADEHTSLRFKVDKLQSDLRMHNANLQGYDSAGFNDNVVEWDRILRIIAFAVAIAGFVMLWFAAVHADDVLAADHFSMITAAMLVPTGLAIFYNLAIAGLMNSSLKSIQAIQKDVRALVQSFNKDVLPAYNKLVKAQQTP